MPTRIRKLTVVIIAAASALIQQSAATGQQLDREWVRQGPVSVRLLSERSGYKNPEGIRLAVHVRLAPGWLTYWRAPGEAGMPPDLDWSGSENLGHIRDVMWPLPRNEDSFGKAVRVYRDEVVLPITASAIDPQRPLSLRLAFKIAICKDVCIPIRTEHRLVLGPVAGNPPTLKENLQLIEAFVKRAPAPDPASCGLRIKGIQIGESGGKAGLRIVLDADKTQAAPSVLVEETPGQLPQLANLESDGSNANWHYWYVPKGTFDPASWKGRRVRLTVLEHGRGLEQIWAVGAMGDSTGAWGTQLQQRGQSVPIRNRPPKWDVNN